MRDGSGTLLPPPDDALAAELAAGELGSLAALFVAAGSRPPTVIWTPAAEQLQSAVLRDLQRLWRETLGCGRRWSPPLLPELGALQDDVMLVAVEEAGADFHYVHYGRNVARAYGRDMVGRRTSEFPGHISRFFAAVYRATLLRRVPVYTDHEPPLGLLVTGWHRLILPLFGGDDGITMFMVGNIADSPLRHVVDMVADPVVVFEPTGRVRLINRPAEQLLATSEAEATARPIAELLQHPLVADLASGAPLPVGGLRGCEMLAQPRGGDPVPVEVSIGESIRRGTPLFIAVLRDVAERKASEAAMRQLAFRDPLTGLANRATFDDRLAQLLARAARHGGRFALHLVDIDDFKAVNDGFGHAAGDQALKVCGQRIATVIRGSDTAARVGGDEFALLQAELKRPQDAAAMAQRILRAIARPVVHRKQRVELSASLGVAFFPDDTSDAVELYSCADAALYAAKKTGRGRMVFYADLERT